MTFDRGRAIPDRLTRGRHAHYLEYAERMLAAYRSGIGQPRRELHRSIQNILAREPECDPRRIAAFCKLLDERAEYAADRKGESAALRLSVFTLAAKHHPLVSVPQRVFERPEIEVKRQIASELGLPWEQIEGTLYADVISFQPLVKFDGYADARALLARYNVAQLQACLYRATKMSVHARSDFKTILRHAKLARLLHEICRLRPGEYRIDLSGPAYVLRETRRYGVNFARFIPALLTCADWEARATLPTPWGGIATLNISSDDGYASHLASPPAFDSSLEEEFARDFGSDQRDGWCLDREGEVLHVLQTTFVPDFVLRHADGRIVHLEIVGFWTPEYLEKKRQTLRQFKGHDILIAVARRSVRADLPPSPNLILFGKKLKAQSVLDALQSSRMQDVSRRAGMPATD